MDKQEKRGAGRPPKPEEELMVRLHITLPLATARLFRARVPEKQRSAFIERLIRREFGLKEKDDQVV